MSTELTEASAVPTIVGDRVQAIAEEACQAAFGVIASRLEALGYPVTGDLSPGEVARLDYLFQGFVLSMCLNNPDIARMQEG